MTSTTEPAATATRSRENTRRKLLDAAAQVFAEVGLAAASVEAVCDRAGFTRGAFYSNFESKDELFLELAGRVTQGRVAAVTERVAELECEGAFTATHADVFDILDQVLEVSADDRLGVLLMSEIRIHALRNPQMARAYLEQELEMQRSVAQIITDIGRAKGITFRMPELDAARVMLLVWEGSAVRAALANENDAGITSKTSSELALVAELLIDGPAAASADDEDEDEDDQEEVDEEDGDEEEE
ncbi:transcriptional regulator, TetR family [Agromyces sp. CF514]|uniref:TetR/AcrR family transcriptional regulator n=1 Tax=Agromyces sp. CF514 TaxID=1881031 RepID=UPI0008F34F9D|nr:TetR/AcrR family transcriptional regulator [Agromyces sp. CF514]SFR82513.1 transcriptional regulator, TetR family [Agromyces sp. CF514]